MLLQRVLVGYKDLHKIVWPNPHDEAHQLILCRSHDIKLQKTGDFGAKCTKFIPFAWKCPQAILRASCRKAGCAFLLQREFSPLAVRFWEPIASLDRQNRSNFRRKISARETYSPPPFIIDSRKIWKERRYFPWASLSASTTATTPSKQLTVRSRQGGQAPENTNPTPAKDS